MASEQPCDQRTPLEPERKVALLKQPQTYPERPTRIDLVETHMSWVFLTDHHAYKLKKPVRYEFLDFSTLAARANNCTEEIRLNQRLTRNVYLGAVPLTIDSQGNVRLGGQGEVIDWLVKMRRLPRERLLDHMIQQHSVRATDISRVALTLANFYKNSPPVKLSGAEYRARLEKDINNNYRELAEPSYGLTSTLVEQSHQAQLELLKREPELFEQRVEEGRIVEGHGDLRPEHICLEQEPVIFDCLEFNRQFRIIDAADELAFLAMECEHLGAAFIGPVLFQVYAQTTADRPPRRLVNFYKAYRACLRAKLAIWHTRELEKSAWPKWRKLADDYLNLAGKYAQQFG
jgi:aminoglycoside phosphotransferase family enzyme